MNKATGKRRSNAVKAGLWSEGCEALKLEAGRRGAKAERRLRRGVEATAIFSVQRRSKAALNAKNPCRLVQSITMVHCNNMSRTVYKEQGKPLQKWSTDTNQRGYSLGLGVRLPQTPVSKEPYFKFEQLCDVIPQFH